jgi:hypothetical protein
MTSPKPAIGDLTPDSDNDPYEDEYCEYCDPAEACEFCGHTSGELTLAEIHHVLAQLQAKGLGLRTGDVGRRIGGKAHPVFGVVPERLLD